jgi:uroporphyrin-III C-methyltransferase/precorrin-2 dehydrogenase/sirohydrochlorin ferrochelatase
MQDASRLPSDRRTARIASLAVLPVFLSLKDRRAVVAGGSAAAAWKAELLGATGARVDLYAPMDELCDLFQDLIGQADPRISHHDHRWTAGILNGAAIAICDAEDESEARAFFDAARAAGVPVNVIDRPEFCQFQFGTIVNRSPVVVGVSTARGAPILGQAIRRRIETLLPASLGAWAALAETIRGTVMTRLEAGMQRRKFWERFSDLAFGSAPTSNDECEVAHSIDRISGSKSLATGRVTLVGAGPGDAELLTLKAVRALQAADVILFDDLVSDEVLELARREAKRMLVGKRGGRESCRQEDINNLMVKLAKAGRRVVRLKSGDPMIFGRAGEEIERLDAEGIPVDIVPGITSALAMAAALGASLTHRDCARSVRFVTGHSRRGALPEDIDWRAVADPSSTTIFYMSGRTAAGIAGKLLAAGLVAATPVVIASAITRPRQSFWTGTLGGLTSGIEQFDLSRPIIIGVGNVFACRDMALQSLKSGLYESLARDVAHV